MRPGARIGLLLLAIGLGGCGSTSATSSTIVSHVSERTASGVRYAAELRVDGTRQCLFQTYGVLAAHVKPFTQTTKACAQRRLPVGPMLVQVAKPRTAFILDRPAKGCAPVRITAAGHRSSGGHASCSTTKPTLRVTPLPRATSLTIAGIAGVTRLVLRDDRCSMICSRLLTSPGSGRG